MARHHRHPRRCIPRHRPALAPPAAPLPAPPPPVLPTEVITAILKAAIYPLAVSQSLLYWIEGPAWLCSTTAALVCRKWRDIGAGSSAPWCSGPAGGAAG